MCMSECACMMWGKCLFLSFSHYYIGFLVIRLSTFENSLYNKDMSFCLWYMLKYFSPSFSVVFDFIYNAFCHVFFNIV